MRVATTENGWVLEAIGDLEWMFLERLPGMAAGDDLPVEQKCRLLPDPLAADVPADDEELKELRSDWDEFVKPELNLAFADARERVAEDLKAVAESTGDPFAVEDGSDDGESDDDEGGTGVPMDPDETYFRLEVPGEHSELWYNTLNQARLLMNEVYDLANSERSLFEQMLRRQIAEEEGEGDEEFEEDAAPDGMLLMLLAQYQFYSFIQNFLVERIMKP